MAPCACRWNSGLEWLPITVAGIIPITFLTTYGIAVGLKHVEADFPYISDTGTKPPESCIFGQLLNMAAVFIGLTCYVRYKQVEEYCRYSRVLEPSNKATLFCGILSAFGMSLVANFQETNVFIVHTIGAFCTFGFGVLYTWIASIMSFKMYPSMTSKITVYIRLILSSLSTISFVCSFTFAALAGHYQSPLDPKKWTPNEPGFHWHIASTATEWALAACFILYFLTFVQEFSRTSVSMPQFTFHVPQERGTGIYDPTHGDDDDDEPMIT